jgi:hypothetical protein
MKRVLMKCGHSSLGTLNGKPVCPSCVGINKGAEEVADIPDLTDRKASCIYCKRLVVSNTDLPFFEHRPLLETDSYYCGCKGWN